VAANSDIEQVEYFWALLSEQRAAVREKLERLYAALARSERGGHLSSVRRKRCSFVRWKATFGLSIACCTRWQTGYRRRQTHCGTAANA
jgi:hypothetical protein